MKLYRDFETVEELDKQYLPSLHVPDLPAIRARWAEDNARMAKTVRHRIAHGPTRDEYLDVFPGPAGAPIHIFLHGGYWRANAPSDFYFVAERLVQDGFCVVVPNYSLAPKASLDEIVRQVRACVRVPWVHLNSDVFDADAANVTISGHSAGGHLTAMVLLYRQTTDYAAHASLEHFAVLEANHSTVLDAHLDRGSRLYREIFRLSRRA